MADLFCIRTGLKLATCATCHRVVNAPGDTCARCSAPDVDVTAEATRLEEASERLVAAAESARLGDTTERRRRWARELRGRT